MKKLFKFVGFANFVGILYVDSQRIQTDLISGFSAKSMALVILLIIVHRK
jgi:hypothetical protein